MGYIKGQNSFVMDKTSRGPVHCWLVLVKAFQAASKYLYAGLAETGADETAWQICWFAYFCAQISAKKCAISSFPLTMYIRATTVQTSIFTGCIVFHF